MIDHFTLKVRSYKKAKAFLAAALAPLGYEVLVEFDGYAGLGAGKPDLWITAAPEDARPTHFAITALDRKSVDAFYQAALRAGARDNGAPGIRAEYHPNYYAAFVLDADGNNIEAVCHTSPKRARAPARGARGREGREGEASA
jgi:catechol 2,3-dioxygenase-like lactoylglutathione lyase family enzyme